MRKKWVICGPIVRCDRGKRQRPLYGLLERGWVTFATAVFLLLCTRVMGQTYGKVIQTDLVGIFDCKQLKVQINYGIVFDLCFICVVTLNQR